VFIILLKWEINFSPIHYNNHTFIEYHMKNQVNKQLQAPLNKAFSW